MPRIKLLKKNFTDKRGTIIDVFVNSPKDQKALLEAITFTKNLLNLLLY